MSLPGIGMPPNLGNGGDLYFANVSLLLHGDGADGSTTFTDNSPSPKTVSATGNAQIDTAQSRFGVSSILFDGSGDKLTVPDSADLNFGSGDFTIEFWIRFNSIPAANLNFINKGWYFGGQASWIVALDFSSGYALQFRGSTDGTNTPTQDFGPAGFTTGVWYHVAISRSGNSLRAFINGVQLGSTIAYTATIFAGNRILSIGGSYTTTDVIDGWMDDIRITKGVGRYTSDFPPPQYPFPNF